MATPRPGRVAAFFDLDRTVLAKSATHMPRRPFGRTIPVSRRAALKAAYAHYLGSQPHVDADEMDRMRAELVTLCRSWDVSQVGAIIEEILNDLVEPFVYAESTTLVNEHLGQGHDVVLVSASGEEIVAQIATMIGATHGVGTPMVISDGRYSGDIEFCCRGGDRAAAIRRLAIANEYDLAACHAYAASIDDLPWLETVGHPTVVNPDQVLRGIAATRDWPTLSFSDPVSARARASVPSTGMVIAATAVGLSALAAGVTWYGLRRRRE